ncbi:MAG TPA: hypothetical protein DCS91_23430 [Microcoleaceae bacterium UBA11344]|jgi:hypothetical protein|nr:hypothetical protein [Microcoleaceae cyanobacterium UBA11344]
MPTEDQPTSPNEPTETAQKNDPFALSSELSLNITEGVELITNQLILGQNVTLDLFGGKTSQIPEAINVDLIAESGIKTSIAELLPKLPRQSIDQIIVSNPLAYFLEYAAPVLKPGGRIYINATKRNPFGKLPNAETLEQLGLKVVQENAPLETRFTNQKFSRETPRNDGTLEIPLSSLKTTILEKIK